MYVFVYVLFYNPLSMCDYISSAKIEKQMHTGRLFHYVWTLNVRVLNQYQAS